GTPAVGALVYIRGMDFTCVTDASGRFTFFNVPSWLGPISISSVSYVSGVRYVSVSQHLNPVPGGTTGAGTISFAAFPLRKLFALAAGDSHSAALKKDGTFWAWGDNSYGQFGNGSFDGKTTPFRAMTENTWIAIGAAGSQTIGLKN